jgi:hypothetical protein
MISSTSKFTALLAAVIITAVVDEIEDETMKMINNIYFILISISYATSLNAAMLTKIAELNHTQTARNHVLQ